MMQSTESIVKQRPRRLFFLIGIGQARRELKEAIDEDPGSAFAHQWYSLRLLFAGHLD